MNATHVLQAESRRQALTVSSDHDEHSDDEFGGGTAPSPFSSPRAPASRVKSQEARVLGIQGGGGGAGGAGGNDDASAQESAAAARQRSLVAQLARYAGDLRTRRGGLGGDTSRTYLF